MRYLIGVDLGTQGSKGVLISEAGQVMASCSLEQTVSTPRPGWVEQDAEHAWWGGFVRVVHNLLYQSQVDPRSIDAVGVSALMPVMLPVDARGKPLRPAILYADTRGNDQLHQINDYLAPTGEPLVVAHDAGPKILWYRENEPERWSRTHAILGAQSYVIGKLTGRRVIDTITATGYRPFVSVDCQTWNAGHCAHFDISPDLMPDLVDVTEVVGEITEAAAAETGLAAGTAVIGGVTDFTAEMVSTGASQPGEVVVSYGTTMCLAAMAPAPPNLTGYSHHGTHRGNLAGLYGNVRMRGAGMATSGALTRWFRDNFGHHERLTEHELGISAYGLLGLEADATPPGADGLLVLPYFSGERSPMFDGDARGLIFGLTLAHGRGHIYRALLEGVAYGLHHNMLGVAEIQGSPERIVATGGGSRSPLWTQIVSDVTGLPQQIVAPSNAALGAAFLAGYSRGIFTSIQDVHRWVRVEREVLPRPTVHELYQEYFAIYRRLYDQTKEEMHALAALTRSPRPAARGELIRH